MYSYKGAGHDFQDANKPQLICSYHVAFPIGPLFVTQNPATAHATVEFD